MGSGFRVWGLGSWVLCLGLGVWGFGFGACGLGGLRFRVSGLGSVVCVLGFGVRVSTAKRLAVLIP